MGPLTRGRGLCGVPDAPHAVNDVSLLAEGNSVGESSLPSVIVSISDDRDYTFKTTDEGVFGLKNDFGRYEPDPYQVGTKGGFGITGVGNRGIVGQPSSTRPSERFIRAQRHGRVSLRTGSSTGGTRTRSHHLR